MTQFSSGETSSFQRLLRRPSCDFFEIGASSVCSVASGFHPIEIPCYSSHESSIHILVFRLSVPPKACSLFVARRLRMTDGLHSEIPLSRSPSGNAIKKICDLYIDRQNSTIPSRAAAIVRVEYKCGSLFVTSAGAPKFVV